MESLEGRGLFAVCEYAGEHSPSSIDTTTRLEKPFRLLVPRNDTLVVRAASPRKRLGSFIIVPPSEVENDIQASSENDFQSQLASISGRLLGVNGFLGGVLLSSRASSAPGQSRHKNGAAKTCGG